MSQKLELPDEIYDALTATARAEGMTPAEWLAKNLSMQQEAGIQRRPLTEYLAGLTGVIDSDTEPRPSRQPTPFSSGIAEKLARQGLKRP